MKSFNQFTLKQLMSDHKKIFHDLRWRNGLYCPKCGSVDVYTKGDTHYCRDCHKQFTDTSGTIFHSSKLSTDKILTAIYFFVSNTRGISSYQLARHISITQASAWKLLTKMRGSIKQDLKFSGEIILDELYLGGNFKWMPLEKKIPKWCNPKIFSTKELNTIIKEYSAQVKMPTIGIIGDNSYFGRVSVTLRFMEESVSRTNVKNLVTRFIENPTRLITDHSMIYPSIAKALNVPHEVCNHSQYIFCSDNKYTSNRVEGLFSQVRRMFSGTYTFCLRHHLQGYLDECAFRYNCRGYSNEQRFSIFSELIFQ